MLYPKCSKCGFAVRKYSDGKCVLKASKLHVDIWEHNEGKCKKKKNAR